MAEVIHRKSQEAGISGDSYREADKIITVNCHDNVLLTLETLENALRLAEDYLQQANQNKAAAKAFITEMGETKTSKTEKIKKLKAQLAKLQGELNSYKRKSDER
mmetsp:Transcript_69446/g.144832  ORF Transcript_69446/g.144832 Transcript_69446/m.144832 type:complete len:105 (+) Transcript_69446:300-614(+)